MSVRDCNGQVCANQARADPQDPAWFGELARALDAEREDRCARITELHAEVAKQFSDVRTYMDTVVEAVSFSSSWHLAVVSSKSSLGIMIGLVGMCRCLLFVVCWLLV